MRITSTLQATTRYDDLEKTSSSLQTEINAMLYQKQRQGESLNRTQLLIKQYNDLERYVVSLTQVEERLIIFSSDDRNVWTVMSNRGATKPVKSSSRVEVQKEFKEASKKLSNLERILTSAKEEFPHLEEVLGRMVELVNDVRVV